ncbi:MAG: ABC transporter permease [Clostridiales bacterium]|nr:ABC transporter permease [Clostridiales bacterium]MCI6434083.1 ABC transporter permease [Clostridiales bacterium]
MTKNKLRRAIAAALCLACLVLAVIGGMNLPKKNKDGGQSILNDLRARSLMNAAGDGIVESYVALAKKQAQADAKAAGGGMSEIRTAVAEAEARVRAEYENAEFSQGVEPSQGLKEAVSKYNRLLTVFGELEAQATQAYIDAHYDEAKAALEAQREELLAQGKDVPETENIQVDMSGFEPTAEMLEAEEAAQAAYSAVAAELQKLYPVLDESALGSLQQTMEAIVYQSGDTFDTQYDRYLKQSGASVGASAYMIRHGDDLIYAGLALLFVAAMVAFYEILVDKLGIPRVVIGVFFVLLCFMCLWYDLSLPTLLSNSVVRMGMNSIMVLAMVPGIQCGISLNLGLPIGLVAGLIGGLVTIEWGIPGWWGFLFAIAFGCAIAALCGYLYAQLLNRLKGEEMSVTTYVGFSIVSLMCIAWLVLPFNSLKLRWPLGTGLRNTIGLDNTNFKQILNNFLSFSIGDFFVPTGLLLFMALCCWLVWLFSRSKTGIAMQAVGNNPRFAQASGINVDKMRIIGTTLSTVLGAVGILVYSQSYGFMQLYTAPRQMGFVAASAILIGGASTSRCKISHVLIGTFLFQGVLTLGMPVANVLVPGSTISETLRILISNGIILYALTKSGGDSRA